MFPSLQKAHEWSRMSESQLVEYAKLALGAPANIDGTVVAGGTVGEIPLENAAFVVPPEEEETAPAEAPPAESGAAGSTAAETAAETTAAETAAETVPAEGETAAAA